jgi:hypothetical protein
MPKVSVTPKYTYIIICHGKFGRENSIYDMKWGAKPLGTFSPFVFTFRFLNFRFLWSKSLPAADAGEMLFCHA